MLVTGRVLFAGARSGALLLGVSRNVRRVRGSCKLGYSRPKTDSNCSYPDYNPTSCPSRGHLETHKRDGKWSGHRRTSSPGLCREQCEKLLDALLEPGLVIKSHCPLTLRVIAT